MHNYVLRVSAAESRARSIENERGDGAINRPLEGASEHGTTLPFCFLFFVRRAYYLFNMAVFSGCLFWQRGLIRNIFLNI